MANDKSFWQKHFNTEEENTTPQKLVQPFIINDNPKKISPLQSFTQNINGSKKFAITAKTANGKYVKGDVIVYKLDDVEIYAPLNSVLMIDTVNKTVFIKDAEKVSKNFDQQTADKIHYIILYTDLDAEESESEIPYRWVSVTGIKNAYYSIQDNSTLIDIDKSIVLSESVSVEDALSVREFCLYFKNSGMSDEDDDFDINNFAGSEYI